MRVKSRIEVFFLDTLLRICISGVFLILFFDALLYPEDTLSLIIDLVILLSGVVAYGVRKEHPATSVYLVTSVVLAAMVYQSLTVPFNTTISLSIILIVGFIYSVMLKGTMMWVMHVITYLLINMIFVVQYVNPSMRFAGDVNDLITVAITYSILYFILTFATAKLKAGYDKLYRSLESSHRELHQKADEIAAQNEELMQTQDSLNAVNSHLEQIINDRTARIQAQNEILLKYSYANAHHLRGPVARLLGLANIYRLDHGLDVDFIVTKMEEQANEIDSVVKQINTELEGGNHDGIAAHVNAANNGSDQK